MTIEFVIRKISNKRFLNMVVKVGVRVKRKTHVIRYGDRRRVTGRCADNHVPLQHRGQTERHAGRF